ncbi:MAG: tetratricopeptide repeat protein [Cytophagales bacterium]|nr:tetratricopeptide repeat protein [Cytophagales bacterium]
MMISFCLFACLSRGQGKRAEKYATIAQAYEEIGEYTNALEYYQQAFYLVDRIQWAQKIGELYIESHQYKEGLLWFNKNYRTNVTKPLYHIYAQLLMYNDQHKRAIRYFKTSNLAPDDKKFWLQSCDSAIYWLKNPDSHIVKNLYKVNSPYSDISPSFYKNELVFSSSREGIIIKKKTGAQNQPHYNLYSTKQKENKSWKKPKIFSLTLNTSHHEGGVCFSKDFQTIYFTRGGTKMYKNQEVEYLKLYKSERENGAWKKPKHFIMNDSTASFGHPFLGGDDDIFLFASDIPEGYGGTDLYICFKDKDGWSLPINLGPNINTEKDELYPFICSDGFLFFSSNGHIGMGGFDLYKSRLKDGKWTRPKNLGYPINTSYDDFSFVMNNSTKTGFFSSNRPKGKGSEDLYEITFE